MEVCQSSENVKTEEENTKRLIVISCLRACKPNDFIAMLVFTGALKDFSVLQCTPGFYENARLLKMLTDFCLRPP